MKNIKKLLCIVLALISVFAFNACGKNGTTEEFPPAEKLHLPTLFDDYYSNHLAADEKYIGNRYRVTTKFDNASEEYVVAGHYQYYPNNRHIDDEVWVDFNLKYIKNQRDAVLGFSEGDSIVFEGTLTRADVYFYDLAFEDVVFIK